MDDILLLKEEELAQYTNRKFLDLLDERRSSIYKSLNEMQEHIRGLQNQINTPAKPSIPHLIHTKPYMHSHPKQQTS